MTPPRRRISLSRKAVYAAIVFGVWSLGFGVIYALILSRGWVGMPQAIESRRLAKELALQAARPRRILIAGDSFLSWWPIPHCLNKDLQAYCDSNRIGLMNTSVGGYGPLEYAERIKAKAPVFKPGLTMIFYYVGNDLEDSINRPDNTPRSLEPEIGMNIGGDEFRGTGAELGIPIRSQSLKFGGDWLGRAAGILETRAWGAETTGTLKPAATPAPQFDWQAMLKHGIDPELVELAKGRLTHPNDFETGYINPYLLESGRVDPGYLVDNVLMESSKAQTGKRAVKRLLLNAFVAARSVKSDVCLVVIPSNVQVETSHYDFYRRATFTMDDRLLTSNAPEEMLGELCKQADVPMVDLLPEFRAAGKELYWKNDDHLNEAGHVLAMKVLREKFLDEWNRTHPEAGAGGTAEKAIEMGK